MNPVLPVQPILSTEPEYGHRREDVLSLSQFLTLLKDEEDYFKTDRENFKVMVSRLRKIFYDKWGWDSMLIRGAASIKGRYNVEIVECPPDAGNPARLVNKVKFYTNNTYTPKCREVTYRQDDRVFGSSRTGQAPEIYKLDHADVRLPDGFHCDIGHVLAGLDALNNPQIVSPLPDYLLFLYKLLPHASSNADVVTWLGDIATSAMDFVFAYLKNERKPLDLATEQHYINMNASASDMLGNIDSYAIFYLKNQGKFKETTISGILGEYYADTPDDGGFRRSRYELFAQQTGLGKWDGKNFSNEKQWLKKYEGQLRSTISFMIYSVTSEPVKSLNLANCVWKKKYEDVIKAEMLLGIFLTALKKLI